MEFGICGMCNKRLPTVEIPVAKVRVCRDHALPMLMKLIRGQA